MPNSATTAAFWSAIAASCAALSSFLTMLIQRRNLLESVRPELVIPVWDRREAENGDLAYEVVSFPTIKNVGRGVALHIHLQASHRVDNRPTVVLQSIRLPILAANEEIPVDGKIILWWENVEPNDRGFKHLSINLSIFCVDARGMRHETRYDLLVVELGPSVGVTDEIAPGVMLASRTTITRSMRWLRLKVNTKRVTIPSPITKNCRSVERHEYGLSR
jgi:hypothetical protein